jgi:hypothetical protein
MRSFVITLSYLFSGLELLTTVLVFPLTILCTLGLIGFTLKIARDMRAKRGFSRSGTAGEPDRLGA